MNEITCTLFNALTEQRIGDVSLPALPRVGELVVNLRERAFEVLAVWHVAGRGRYLVVKEISTGLPGYMKAPR